jgi:small GTP-binding protein
MKALADHKIVKLAVVGNGGAGKSTLISKLTTGEYLDNKMTIGFDVESWTFSDEEDSSAYKVSCFDFGGQTQFRFFQGSLILGSKIALIVFDCTSYNSLLKIDEWMELLTSIPNDMKLLVGTKHDLGLAIPQEDIQTVADHYGLDYMLVSSKSGENFDLLCQRLKSMTVSLEKKGIMQQVVSSKVKSF